MNESKTRLMANWLYMPLVDKQGQIYMLKLIQTCCNYVVQMLCKMEL